LEANECPAIVYVSRTRKAKVLSEKLSKDGFNAKAFHGKMDVKEKIENQNAFIAGDVQIIVATSAFGMVVDKKDVGLVIHDVISDSLENYVQEAGRAARDENITAECYVLHNEEDLSKHFILLNQTKLGIKEIQQVWKAIKDLTRFRLKVSNSALEIARKAGWDDTVGEIKTRVSTAISALEEAGYLKRGQNMPRVFANSILSKTAQKAIEKILASNKFDEKQKEKAVRIIKKLFSGKSRKQSQEDKTETRVDYISDHLGIGKEDVIHVIVLLREEGILADMKDLTGFIKKGEKTNKTLEILETFIKIEDFLLPQLSEDEVTYYVKRLNEDAEANGCSGVSPSKIKTVLNFWAIKNWIKRNNHPRMQDHLVIILTQSSDYFKDRLLKRRELAKFIVEFLYEKMVGSLQSADADKMEKLVEFSLHELKSE